MENKKEQRSLYEKLQAVKYDLSKSGLKKDIQGFGFQYMGLPNIIPPIEKACYEHRITAVTTFVGDNICECTVYDWDSEKTIVIQSPVKYLDINSPQNVSANGKKALKTEIQALGAIQTYMRRYMLFTLFDIAENDLIDETEFEAEKNKPVANKSKPKQEPTNDKITEIQIKVLKAYGATDEQFSQLVTYCKVNTVAEIPSKKAEEWIKKLEQEKGKKTVAQVEQPDEPDYYGDMENQYDEGA